MKGVFIQNIDLPEIEDHLRLIIREELSSLIGNFPKQVAVQEKFLSKKEAANYLHISTVTLSKYVKQGYVNAHRLAGNRLKFKRSELENAFKPLKHTINNNKSSLK
jgi:excisionase family DNA binding protein